MRYLKREPAPLPDLVVLADEVLRSGGCEHGLVHHLLGRPVDSFDPLGLAPRIPRAEVVLYREQ